MRASGRRSEPRCSTRPRWLTLALSLGLASLVGAATWVVTTTDDAGPGSLRDAITQANQNPGADQIAFDPALAGQTVNLRSGELAITDEVTIEGLGASQLTVRRAADAGTSFRVLDIDDGAPGEIAVLLRNLTIAGGEVDSEPYEGGGIRSTENLTLEGSVVSDNQILGKVHHDTRGGGVYSSGSLTLLDSVVTENLANSSCSPSSLTLLDCVFGGKPTSGRFGGNAEGGGVYSSGPLLVRNSTISDNEAVCPAYEDHGRGGGIASSGTLELRASTITGNRAVATGYQAYAEGGGVFSSGGLIVARSTFSDNSCEASGMILGMLGGGLEGDGQVWNSTFSNNRAGTDSYEGEGAHAFGGAMYGELSVYNSTIVANQTDISGSYAHNNWARGGGFYAVGASRLVSTIVSGNVVSAYETSGTDLLAQDGWQLAHHNLVSDPTDSGIVIGEDGNITGDPELGPLQANGGPTLTCAIPVSSPAVNTGSNPLQLIADQRGFQPRDAYGATDIGAYENGAIELGGLLFADSFELGDTSGWPLAVP